VPANTLELPRVAERHRVPGVGRQRAMELVRLGFHTLQDVLQAGSDQLLDILKKLADGDSTLKRYRGHDGSQ
jgi:helicase